MRKLLLTYAVLLCTLTVAGQAESVTVADLHGMVHRGLKISTRGAHRYTLKMEQNKTVVLEVDGKGSLRVKDSDDRAGVISECIIIGERMYHRWGNYPWISQTRDEFDKAQATLGAAIREAKAKKDTEAFQKAKSATLNNPAIFRALWRPASNAVVGSDSSGMSDKSIAFVGNLPYKDTLASFYRLHGNTSKFTSPTPGLLSIETDIVYAFDPKTGALLQAQMRQDVVYESTKKTFFTTDEWEQDMSIVITPPDSGAEKKQS
jgi:hypothetical protein